jgi:hypothetical protein
MLMANMTPITTIKPMPYFPAAKKAGMPSTIGDENDGRLEHAQQMAGHESPRTTKLYDRTKDEITLSEVERIRL